jgi:MFS-type transporter involved in bile tolerance (Atg22 family)
MKEVKKSSLFSWLLFDLANTVYAFVIPGLYFSVWLVTEQGWTDQALGFATSSAMVIVAITGPWVGARSDGSQGKKPLLLITTLACIISTFLLGTFNVNTSVILFMMLCLFQLVIRKIEERYQEWVLLLGILDH